MARRRALASLRDVRVGTTGLAAQLFRADAAGRLGDHSGATEPLAAATRWTLHSGSVEHLCVYHLVRSRTGGRSQDFEAAERAVEEGLHLTAPVRSGALSLRAALRACRALAEPVATSRR